MPSRVLGKLGARQGIVARESDGHARLVEALRTSGLGAVKRIARHSNLSAGAIYKQLEDENRSALELLCRWLDGALEAKPDDQKAALAPLFYLMDRYLSRSGMGEVDLIDVDDAVAKLLWGVGAAAQAAIVAMEDRQVDDGELQAIRRLVTETINSLHLLKRLAEVANGRWRDQQKAKGPAAHQPTLSN